MNRSESRQYWGKNSQPRALGIIAKRVCKASDAPEKSRDAIGRIRRRRVFVRIVPQLVPRSMGNPTNCASISSAIFGQRFRIAAIFQKAACHEWGTITKRVCKSSNAPEKSRDQIGKIRRRVLVGIVSQLVSHFVENRTSCASISSAIFVKHFQIVPQLPNCRRGATRAHSKRREIVGAALVSDSAAILLEEQGERQNLRQVPHTHHIAWTAAADGPQLTVNQGCAETCLLEATAQAIS